jgi:hypothetical protein
MKRILSHSSSSSSSHAFARDRLLQTVVGISTSSKQSSLERLGKSLREIEHSGERVQREYFRAREQTDLTKRKGAIVERVRREKEIDKDASEMKENEEMNTGERTRDDGEDIVLKVLLASAVGVTAYALHFG